MIPTWLQDFQNVHTRFRIFLLCLMICFAKNVLFVKRNLRKFRIQDWKQIKPNHGLLSFDFGFKLTLAIKIISNILCDLHCMRKNY